MNGASEPVLAGAGLAEEQDVACRVRHRSDQELIDRAVVADAEHLHHRRPIELHLLVERIVPRLTDLEPFPRPHREL